LQIKPSPVKNKFTNKIKERRLSENLLKITTSLKLINKKINPPRQPEIDSVLYV